MSFNGGPVGQVVGPYLGTGGGGGAVCTGAVCGIAGAGAAGVAAAWTFSFAIAASRAVILACRPAFLASSFSIFF